MQSDPFQQRRQLEQLDRSALAAHQLERVNQLLATILPSNSFYAEKFGERVLPLASLAEFRQLPLTVKKELVPVAGQGELARNLTYPAEQYVRFHRTSGTRGQPMVVLDSADDWQWWIDTWQYVLDAAQVTTHDRVMLAFSFGPFIGFWSANDAAAARGATVIPGGGMSSLARLALINSADATVLCCTPTYALRLAEVATQNKIDIASGSLSRIIVAGEPGGSLPAMRNRIQTAWNAQVVDHCGATEIGPWGYADPQHRGLYINEAEFLPEFLPLAQDDLTPTSADRVEGELAELVLTTLARPGAPLLRYRTGDLVRPRLNNDEKNQFVLLEGGVLGRVDDMMTIRGVNLFPSSIEEILRSTAEVVEYRITVDRHGEMDQILVEVEDSLHQPERIAKSLELGLGLRVEVREAPADSLPRFEGKGKRFLDRRATESQEPTK